jgi:hypothetical protein
MQRLSRRQLTLFALEAPPVDVERPRTRGDCASVVRPCPFLACRYHLALEVNPRNGSIKRRFPGVEPDKMDPTASCVLDVADRGGTSLREVGALLNVTRERARQIERAAIRRVRTLTRGTDEKGNETMSEDKKKAPSKAEGRRVEIELPCRLTDEELIARGQSIAELHEEAGALRLQKVQASGQIGGEIKAKEAAIGVLVQQLRTRTEARKVECVEELDFKEGIARTRRLDTKEIVGTRTLTAAERQPSLFPIEGGKSSAAIPPVAVGKKRGRKPKAKLAAVPDSAPAGA